MPKTVLTTKKLTQPLTSQSNKRKKIGILGGTFNPIHMGHLIIADQVLNQLGLSQVRFMPDYNPPHIDTKIAIDAKDRVNMINLAIRDNPKFAIEMEEVIRGGTSYTYDTMIKLRQLHPENEYYFMIGGDMVNYLPKWYKIDELVNLVHFVGVKREDYSFESQYPIIWVDIPNIGISSTAIRSNLRNKQSIKYLVPQLVENYIKEHQLYGY